MPAPTRKCLTLIHTRIFYGGKLLLRVVYILVLYNTVYKLNLKYSFLRCLTMGSMDCYQYMRSVHIPGAGLLVISMSRLRVGAGIDEFWDLLVGF
jgi:hypothetical protein